VAGGETLRRGFNGRSTDRVPGRGTLKFGGSAGNIEYLVPRGRIVTFARRPPCGTVWCGKAAASRGMRAVLAKRPVAALPSCLPSPALPLLSCR